MIRRLLIANRGEIALRIVRACRELGVETVAVPGRRRRARAARAGGRSRRRDRRRTGRRQLLEHPAPHRGGAFFRTPTRFIPATGFLSENAAFATACVEAGIVFVGPPAAVIERMGSKIEARRLAAAATAFPVVPGETPADQSDDGVLAAIRRVGLPVLVKASAGGGGKGMRPRSGQNPRRPAQVRPPAVRR